MESPRRQRHPAFVIPSSPTLLRLAETQVAAEARKCLAQLGASPTAPPWEMLLAPTASTCVIAGAGSGKSTTLILRLLVLHKVLSVPLEEMHVFSFTRASTREFQRRLAEKLIRWEELIERKEMTDQRRAEVRAASRRTVSTFHSVLASLSRDLLPPGGHARGYFDLLGNTSSTEDGEDALSGYNPFVTTSLSDEQATLLGAVHSRAYQESAPYRELMAQLEREQERLYWQRAAGTASLDERMEQWKWEQLLRQEQTYHGFTEDGHYAPLPGYPDQRRFQYVDPYRAAVADRLHEWGIPFHALAPFSVACPIPGGFPGLLYASFKIGEQLLIHVERFRTAAGSRGPNRNLSFHERTRRRFIALYSTAPDQHRVLGPEDFDASGPRPVLTAHGDFKLQQWLNLSGYATPGTSAPPLRVQLPGDLRRLHIAELLYQEGLFIESLGLEVEQFQEVPHLYPDPTSAAVAEALPQFWRALRQELARRDLVRFHDLLAGLRDAHTLLRLIGKLKHMRHLLVDEFQDVSPEIVDWLAKTLRLHVENGAEVSVTAIGDDYQSIYGWRGSHPAFLMHFKRHFPAETVGRLILAENFRSRQAIIDAAEAVLAPVGQKIPKHGEAALRAAESGHPHPVYLVEAPLAWASPASGSDLWQSFCAYCARLLADLQAAGLLSQLAGQRQTLSVFVLARTNLTRLAIPDPRQLSSSLLSTLARQGVGQFRQVDIRRGTFHQSKGLEADVVLLLDDSLPPDERHPLREHAFSLAPSLGEAGTYGQNIADEARRLAYVALTRARLGVMWAPLAGAGRRTEDEAPAGANGKRQTDAVVAAEGCFALVKHYLQATAHMR